MEKFFYRDPEKEKRRKLRSTMPPAELTLWAQLRLRRISGCTFRRQAGIGYYTVDFYCSEKKLAIEVDGDSHSGNEAYDIRRQKLIESFGVHFLRAANVDVFEALEGVVEIIKKEIKSTTPCPS